MDEEDDMLYREMNEEDPYYMGDDDNQEDKLENTYTNTYSDNEKHTNVGCCFFLIILTVITFACLF